MPNTKLMREALEAIYEFWRESGVPLSPYALIGESEQTAQTMVWEALNTDEDARSDQDDGDVHIKSCDQWAEFSLRKGKACEWWDGLDHPLKHITEFIGRGNDFRAAPFDVDKIIDLMQQAGLDVRDYR
jgi:hypothetical protein